MRRWNQLILKHSRQHAQPRELRGKLEGSRRESASVVTEIFNISHQVVSYNVTLKRVGYQYLGTQRSKSIEEFIEAFDWKTVYQSRQS